MIGISTKTVYAVAALYELSSLPLGETLKIKDIAAKTAISKNFLEQILLELKKSGFLTSIKGAHGGYKLAKPISDIMLKDIVFTLEGDAFSSPCKTDNSALKIFWQDRQEEIKKLFDLSMAELENCQQRADKTLDYCI